MLLAAGDGTRLGQPKATVELGGMTLAERGAGLLRDGGADPVLVVTGAAPVQVPGTIGVHNPDWPSGMGSSLAAGLRALVAGHSGSAGAAGSPGAAGSAAAGPDPLSGGVSAVVIALADQPLVGSAAVRRLIDAYAAGAVVAVAAYDGKPRNPVLIACEQWAAVLAVVAGDTGARPFLRAHPELVTLVECGDVGRPDDIDTPQDLARVRSQLSSLPGCLVTGLAELLGLLGLRLDAPADGDGFLRLQHHQVLAARERVRRAGHRLNRDCRPAPLGLERVAGEDL